MSKIIEMCHFSEKKAPAGASDRQKQLFRTYLHKINSFSQSSQKVTFPHFRFFGNVLRYQDTFLPKTKMVRVVHMNIFYRMDLEIYDSKSELQTKTENLTFQKNENFSFGVQNGLLRLIPSPEYILNIFQPIPQSSRLNPHI